MCTQVPNRDKNVSYTASAKIIFHPIYGANVENALAGILNFFLQRG
jgi:hypothetical protein